MYQKDYILRMVEMLADMIALVLGLIKRGEYKQASVRLERIYYDMLKQDALFFQTIPEKQLTSKLIEEHNFTNDHLEILAELFNTEAELDLAQGDGNGSIEYSRKALLLFNFIDKESKTYSADRVSKMALIKQRIASIQKT